MVCWRFVSISYSANSRWWRSSIFIVLPSHGALLQGQLTAVKGTPTYMTLSRIIDRDSCQFFALELQSFYHKVFPLEKMAFAVLIYYLHVDFSFRVIRITFFDLVTFLVNLWNPCSKKVGEIDGLSLLVAVDAWLAQYRSRMRSNAQTLVEISFRKYCFGNWDFTAAQVVWHQEEDGRRQFAYVGHETAAVEEIFILDHCRVPLQLANKVFSSFVARKKVWMQSALFGIYFIIWAVRRTEWLSKSVLIMATLAQT